ncbi:MAG: 4Fe-4S dicluster domain-containing protein [Candidatus Thorarchaeota archaeon]|jgi:NAD-dependent dihydropyrimidine dehydrogenase PreA subunit
MNIVIEDTDLGIEYNPEQCNRCGICIEVCPFGVWEIPEEGPAILARPEDCTNCTACAKNCLGNAITVTNLGCGCVWNESARRSGKFSESVVGQSKDASSCGSEDSSCCG